MAKSSAAALAWHFLDSNAEGALFNLQAAAMREKVPPDNYLLTGPRRTYSNEEELFTDLAEVWRRSSLLMHQMCEGQGCRYFHFLQPNQYAPGAKDLSREERRVAYRADHPYRPGAERGYPYLRRAGRSLAQGGVRYHDLTLLFSRVAEPIYVDACCHYNLRGARRVAAAMARVIARDFAGGASPSGGRLR